MLIALLGKETFPINVVLESVAFELKTIEPVPIVAVVPVPPRATGKTPEVMIDVSTVAVVAVRTRPLVSVVMTGNPVLLEPTVVAVPTLGRTALGSVPVLRTDASSDVILDAWMTRPLESTAIEGILVVEPNVCVGREDKSGKASGSRYSAMLLVVAA